MSGEFHKRQPTLAPDLNLRSKSQHYAAGQSEAKGAIQDAIFVLGLIIHDAEHLRNVAVAIDALSERKFDSSINLARAVTKGRKLKHSCCSPNITPRSLDELKAQFQSACLILAEKPIDRTPTMPPQSPTDRVSARLRRASHRAPHSEQVT